MSDLDVIHALEADLDISLPNRECLSPGERGYVLDGVSKVVSLSLHLVSELQDLSPLSGLTQLKFLSLSGNMFNQSPVNDLSPLSGLTVLTSLDMRHSQVNDLSCLSDIATLTSLDLTSTQVSDLSPLSGLTALTSLSLSDTQVSDLSPLSGLTRLITLELMWTQVSDLSPLSGLTALTSLSLSDMQVSDLSPLSGLTALTSLSLRSTQISDLSPLSGLTALTSLSLRSTQVNDLSPLSGLTALTSLSLRYTQVNDLSPLSGLTALTELDTVGCPIEIPPPEVVQQGIASIHNYFEQIAAQQTDYLYEAKLLIIGQGGAGKTTMTRKLLNPNSPLPTEDESTHGIDVHTFAFPMPREAIPTKDQMVDERTFRLNIWDFGGQRLYLATHRLFFSHRSLFALVADSRKEDTDFNYWLELAEMFGGESPLLVVLNEQQGRKPQVEPGPLRERFEHIVDFVDVDFAEDDKSRLQRLKEAVQFHARRLPQVGNPVPARWTDVRRAIEERPENSITLHDYLALCAANGIDKVKDTRVLSQYFHDIGVFLHFQDDGLLDRTLFLKPNWATNAVYRVLDHPRLGQQQGRFSRDDASTIWHEESYELIRNELLRLMQRFLLIYEIDSRGEYIVPARLPGKRPNFEWDENGNLQLRYAYGFFMPRGILSQLTVQLNHLIEDHNLVWLRGVLLARNGARAQVTESYDRRSIEIRVAGRDPRELMTLITAGLDQINDQYPRLKVEKLLPCNCRRCVASPDPYFFKDEVLRRRLDHSRTTIECELSYESIEILPMLGAVFDMGRPDNERDRAMFGRAIDASLAAPGPPKSAHAERNLVFVSYAHEDVEWLTRIQTQVDGLRSAGIDVDLWDDTQIKAGMVWRDEIERALAAAKVAVLLITPAFLASEFIQNDELPPLLAAAERQGVTILSVVVAPCLFSRFEQLTCYQTVNDPAHPLTTQTPAQQDQVFVNLAERIAELVAVT